LDPICSDLGNSAGKSPGSSRDQAGESRYDEVSRNEKKRLESERSDRASGREKDRSEGAGKAAESRASERNNNQQATETGQKTKEGEGPEEPASTAGLPSQEKSGVTEVDVTERDVTEVGVAPVSDLLVSEDQGVTGHVPVTFASLQPIVKPEGGKALPAGPAGEAVMAGQPAALAGVIVSGQLAAQPGKAGPGGSQATPGIQLTELLSAGIQGESGKALEAATLNAPRFQATLDVASQQASQVSQAARQAAEVAVPLRSYATSIDVPVGQADWGDKVMGKLSWLTARNMSVAEIHLTPPDMGPMEVKVRVQNDQATVTVHAANPVVREQLELNSHRLRDMLGEQGLSLDQFDVSDQSRQQAGGGDAGGGDEGGGHGDGSHSLAASESEDSMAGTGDLDLAWRGELDVFA